jgi:YD repeat-containing protein
MITAQGRSKALVSAVLQILFICLFASSVTASIPSIVNPSAVYNTAQVAPANGYFEGYQEQIDPATGALVVTQLDFSLPGRNDLDFELKRVYRSNMAGSGAPRVEDTSYDMYYYHGGSYMVDYWQTYDYDYSVMDFYTATYEMWFSYDQFYSDEQVDSVFGTYYLYSEVDYEWEDEYDYTDSEEWYGYGAPDANDGVIQPCYLLDHSVDESLAYDPYGFGLGWTLSLPIIREIDGISYLTHENGKTYEIKQGSISNYKLKDLLYSYDSSFYSGQKRSHQAVTRADGKKWYFDLTGKLLGITNRFGDTIKVEYDLVGRIALVFDTVQRKIEFTYDDNPASTITVAVYAPLDTNPQTWQSTAATTWVYSLTPISTSTHRKLTQVTPPAGLPIHYEYAMQSAGFLYNPIIDYEDNGPGYIDYLNMTRIDNPTQGDTFFEWESFSEIFNTSDDLTQAHSNYIESFRVNRRYDSVPTSHFALDQSETITTQISGDSRFVYGALISYEFKTTRTEYNGATPGLVEKWYYNSDYIQTKHEIIVDGAGANRLQTETLRDTRKEIFNQLPIETRIETCYDGSCGPTNVTITSWTNKGQVVWSLNPAGQLVTYEYDPTYGLMTSKLDGSPYGIRVGYRKEGSH